MSRHRGAIDRDKQNAILEAAIDVAGSARPSLAAIASRAGVSRQTVHNQFGGAQGLKLAVLDSCRAALWNRLSRSRANRTLEPPWPPMQNPP